MEVCENAVGSHADLTSVQRCSYNTLPSGLLQICVFAYDSRILASQLHQTRFQILAARLRYLSSCSRAPGEIDLANSRMFDHYIRDLRRVFGSAVYDVEYASR